MRPRTAARTSVSQREKICSVYRTAKGLQLMFEKCQLKSNLTSHS